MFELTEFEMYCKRQYENGGKVYLEKPMQFSEFEALMVKDSTYQKNNNFHEKVTTSSPGYTIKDLYTEDEQVDVVLHKRYSYPVMHNHAYVELVYVMSGECTHFIEKSAFTMKKGDVCILAPNAMHAISATSDDAIILNVIMSKKMFDFSFLKMLKGGRIISNFFEDVLYNRRVSPYILFPTGDDQEIHDLMFNIYREKVGNSYLCHVYIILSLKQFFIRLIRTYELLAVVANPVDNLHENHIVALMGYININYRNITLKQTSQFFGYNEIYLGKMIKQYTGQKFTALISTIQMENAAKLLRETSLKVIDVGNEVGCYDTSHFIRKFKEVYGVTPSNYKKIHSQHRDNSEQS